MIHNAKQFTDILEEEKQKSVFLQRLNALRQLLAVKGFDSELQDDSQKSEGKQTFRAITKGEIEILQRQGNCAADWGTVLVSPDFSVEGVRNSLFFGKCYLGCFTASKNGHPPGIYNSIVGNSIVLDNSLIYGNCRL